MNTTTKVELDNWSKLITKLFSKLLYFSNPIFFLNTVYFLSEVVQFLEKIRNGPSETTFNISFYFQNILQSTHVKGNVFINSIC